MANNLPYLSSPGTIRRAFSQIQAVPTPPRVTPDFVKTRLQIKGGPGNAMASFLKKIGFVNQDGSPSPLYTMFRNAKSSGKAVADAMRFGYAILYERNEYFHELSDKEMRGLIIEVTGCAKDARTIELTLSCIKNLKHFSDFGQKDVESLSYPETDEKNGINIPETTSQHSEPSVGLNIGYTINLNLPATTDIAVFDAIFKSLKENLLRR